MASAIDFHDEPDRRREQMHDVALGQHDLAAEVDTKAPGRQGAVRAS
jgi:hypothetical protein